MKDKQQESRQIVESNQSSLAISLSKQHAATVMQNVDTLTTQFKTWMDEGVDYTRELYGKSEKPSLLDPGAHKLTSFFQAYPDPHILEHIEERDQGKERIKYVVRADIIHVSGVRIGSGIGSCTTDEAKYQYRWLTEYKLKQLGYTDSEIQILPSQDRRGRNGTFKVYKIRNPEILDLDNTILKMATKRAEVDAALSLPGVSGVFTQDIEQYPDALGINDGQQNPSTRPPRRTHSETKVKERHPRDAKQVTEQDPDIENVINAFLDKDLRTTDLVIVKKNGSIWVQHPTGFDEEQFNKYQEAMIEAGINPEYYYEKNAWEVKL